MILLTGGLGFIGSHTIVELASKLGKNTQIVILDNLVNSKKEVLNNLYKIIDNKLYFVEGDITNDKDLEKVFKYHIDCVIHFAALKSVSESIKCPLDYYKNNIYGLINLLEKCEKYNVFKFIFSSSATVYGDSVSPLTEESIVGKGISNPYGQTKFMGEQILKDLSTSNTKFKIIILRYFNPVGAHSSSLIGEDPNGIPNNLMPYIVRVAIKNNIDDSLPDVYKSLSIFGDGNSERDFIHVVDLANAHVCAYNYLKNANKSYNVFNIGTGKSTSVLELVNCFKNVNNIKLPYKFKEKREGDLDIVYCKCIKANKELKWKSKLNIEDICRDSYNYAKKLYF